MEEPRSNVILPSAIRQGDAITAKQAAALASMEGMKTFLNARADMDDGDLEKIVSQQLASIFTAPDMATAWKADLEETEGARDMVGTEFRLHEYSVHRSNRFVNGFPTGREEGEFFWILMEVTLLSNGERRLINTGAIGVMAKAVALEKFNALGKPEADCVIVGVEAPNGTVLKMAPITQRATPGMAWSDEEDTSESTT